MDLHETNTFRYICPVCGCLSYSSINIFELSDKTDFGLYCSEPICGNKCGSVKKTDDKAYTVTIACPFCNSVHSKRFSTREMWGENIKSVRCNTADKKIAVFGSDGVKTFDAFKETYDYARDTVSESEHTPSETSFTAFQMQSAIQRLIRTGDASCVCGSEFLHCFTAGDNRLYIECKKCKRRSGFDISGDNLARLLNTTYLLIGN